MSIVLERLSKRFGQQLVVDLVSLEVADRELFVLLGASGSGKSTVLRQIAGLIQPDSGRILLNGRDVTTTPPQQRNTGFVFQNYSIFRHMSVADNIEFGLKIRDVPAAERARRRDHLLELVGLAGLGARYAHQLSGGQQQRVALARALAYEPKVLLLDEPFGALDVKIRAQLRRSLKQIQQQLAVTTILVTHDQEEAFELADRIGVMDRGQLLEVGTSEQLYRSPRTSFVATFLGLGTVLVGRKDARGAHFGSLSLPLPAQAPDDSGNRVQVLFRPEQVCLSADRPASGATVIGQGTIVEQTFTGAQRRVRLRLPHLAGARQIAPTAPFGEAGLLVDAILPAEAPLPADEVWVTLRGWHLLNPPQRRVLLYCPTLGEPLALRWTCELARQLDATVTLLRVDADPTGKVRERGAATPRPTAGDVRTDLRVRQGDPIEQLAHEQAETLYDLLVLPIPSRNGRRDSLAMQVLERMNRFWSTPVLITSVEPPPIRYMLICTAAGEPGKSDVRVGGRLARQIGAAVTLLYVAPTSGLPEQAHRHLDRASRTLEALDVEGRVQTRQAAHPTDGIIAEADGADYDLIVMGSHGPEARSVFGHDDITFQVASRTERSLLIVPDESV